MENNTTACAVWSTLDDLFHNNKESHAIYINVEFSTFAQDDLSISDYYRKVKTLTDALGNADKTMSDKTLALTTLHGLNGKFSQTAMLLSMFPSFVEVWSHLLLEELKVVQQEKVAQSIALLADISGNKTGGSSSSGYDSGSGNPRESHVGSSNYNNDNGGYCKRRGKRGGNSGGGLNNGGSGNSSFGD